MEKLYFQNYDLRLTVRLSVQRNSLEQTLNQFAIGIINSRHFAA